MDFERVFKIFKKGVGLVKTLIDADARADATTALLVVNDFITKVDDQGLPGVTEEDLTHVEATLDALIESFNAPMENP